MENERKILVRVSKETHRRLRELAAANDRTMSSEIRHRINRAYDALDAVPASPGVEAKQKVLEQMNAEAKAMFDRVNAPQPKEESNG